MIYQAGVIVLEKGDRDRALKYFTNVDRHVRGHLDAKMQIARIHYSNQKVLQADEYLNQILRIDPGHDDALALRRQI